MQRTLFARGCVAVRDAVGLVRKVSETRAWLGAIVLAGALAVPATAAAAPPTDYTYTGLAPTQGLPANPNWSNGLNWGGTAPSNPVGTLAFPVLTACPTTGSQTTACYSSDDDISGLSPNALTIDLTGGYHITNVNPPVAGLTLNAGGLTATTSGLGQKNSLVLPITLGAAQTWSIDGGSGNSGQQTPGELSVGDDDFSDHNSNVGVSGPGEALTIALAHGGTLDVDGNVEVGPINITGTPSESVTVHGAQSPSAPSANPASLNGTNGAAVSVSGATLNFADLQTFPASPYTVTSGPLTVTGAGLYVGGPGDMAGDAATDPTDLSVDGGVTLDSASTTTLVVAGNGFDPARNSEIEATGNVALAGALALPETQATSNESSCETGADEVRTLVSTTGTLSGTFTGVPEGTVLPMPKCSIVGLRVNYNTTTSPETVTLTDVPLTTTPPAGAATTTTLAANPTSAVTNQAVTLTATVASGGSGTPTGAAAFDNNGVVIPGCSAQPVSAAGTATCQTAFTAASPPTKLTAAYAPADASFAASNSTGSPVAVKVAKDTTTTALAVSNASPTTGQSVTYTATVTPGHAGSTEPSGSVQFLDGTTAIAACANQPLAAGSAGSTATCAVSYAAGGGHIISVSYAGDASFTGSASTLQAVNVNPPAGSTGASSGSGTLKIATPKLSGNTLTVSVSCATGGASCVDQFQISVTEKIKKGKKTTTKVIVLGTVTVTLAAGKSTTVKITLNKAGKKLLAQHGTLKTKLAVTTKTAGKTKTITTKTVTFKIKKTHKG